MKNISFIAFCILLTCLTLGSCGNKTEQNTEEIDSTEQVILADSIVAELDSLAGIISDVSQKSNILDIFKKGSINLTEQQKKVKPDYLLTKDDVNELITIQQKYVAQAYLCVDQTIAELYGQEEDDYYKNSIARLAAETENINKNSSEIAEKSEINLKNATQFYKDMKERNCLDKFYLAQAAFAVEALYIMSKNIDLFVPQISDDKVAAITSHLSTVIKGVDIIASNHEEMAPITNSLKLIEGINATSSAELKEQLKELQEPLFATRNELLK